VECTRRWLLLMVVLGGAGGSLGASAAAKAEARSDRSFDIRTRTYVKVLHACGDPARLFLQDIAKGSADAASIKTVSSETATLCGKVFQGLKKIDAHDFKDASLEGQLAAYAYREGMKSLFTYANTKSVAVGKQMQKDLASAMGLEGRTVRDIDKRRAAVGLAALR
jgi:hypothetical protein